MCAPLILGTFKKSRRAADQKPARDREFGDALPAAFVERARAVADAPPAREQRRDGGMVLEALKLVVRRKMRIVVIEPDDKAQRDFAGLQMIDERAAVSRRRQRPADRVEDFARARVFVFDFPQFFDSDAVGLRRRFAAQIEFARQFFRQRAAAALGEDGVFGAQFDSALKIRPARAVFFDSDIAGGDARDGALVVEQNLGGGETRKNLDSRRLGAGGEPSDDAPQTDDKIAFVFH